MFDGKHVFRYDENVPLPRIEVRNLGFTGHRDWFCADSVLSRLVYCYPGANWVYGDAEDGFDDQVEKFAKSWFVPLEPIRPDYAMYSNSPKFAPIARNFKIVDKVDLLVALWDGRTSGGTFRTIDYADKLGKPIVLLQPCRRVND